MDSPHAGVIYCATQKEWHLHEAVHSAESLKRHCPHVPVTLFTNMTESPLARSEYFDDVQEIENHRRSKVLSLGRSPYQRTCYLDVDTTIMAPDLADLFGLLDVFDMAMALNPNNSFTYWKVGKPCFNSGVVLFRKCAKTDALLGQWWATVLEHDLARQTLVGDEHKLYGMDQFALLKILSPTENKFGVSVKILDEGWNFRYPPDEASRARLKILHWRM